MTSLRFHQIYPHQKMPVLAKDFQAVIPKRAELFCHPFKDAKNAGCYFFSPIDFEFKLSEQQLQLRVKRDDGSFKLWDISIIDESSNHNFILLSDISEQKSNECLTSYRQRIVKENVPDFINVDSFGFYEVMVNVFLEKDSQDVFFQIWLGGVLETEQGECILIKHPSNVFSDSGFICLDGIINSSKWQGWMAVVIKPTEKECWVTVDREQPLCQIIGLPTPIDSLETISAENVETDIFMKPIQWHLFDETYNRKPGKYQRELLE